MLEGEAVALDVVPVELPAESRRLRERDAAVFDLRAVDDQVPPDGIAIGMEDLEKGAVGNRAEEVARDLRLLVMRHLHVERRRHRGNASPFGRAAGPGRVKVA